MGPVLMADSSFLRTNVSLRDQIRYTVNITFLKVKMEDYGRPLLLRALKTMAREGLLTRSDVICSVGGDRGHQLENSGTPFR